MTLQGKGCVGCVDAPADTGKSALDGDGLSTSLAEMGCVSGEEVKDS